jgi:hypothetical protein
MADVLVFAYGDVKTQQKGFLGGQKGIVSVPLPVDTIRKNLGDFLACLDQILPDGDTPKKGYGLDSFEVAVSIDAKGQVGFLGTGAEVGGSATLTLSFKKS